MLNAIVTGLGLPPQAWISLPFWNSFFLMVILIWIQTGFAGLVGALGVAVDRMHDALFGVGLPTASLLAPTIRQPAIPERTATA